MTLWENRAMAKAIKVRMLRDAKAPWDIESVYQYWLDMTGDRKVADKATAEWDMLRMQNQS